MARSASTRYSILLLVLLSFLVCCEVASAVDESKVTAQGSETRRLLRGDGGTELSKVNGEERTITDLSKNLKTWAKNTHVVKNWQLKVDTKKVEKAKELYLQRAPHQAYLKAKITPEQLYKALDFKEDMRIAMAYYGNWARLHNNPKYTLWRDYDTIWLAAKNNGSRCIITEANAGYKEEMMTPHFVAPSQLSYSPAESEAIGTMVLVDSSPAKRTNTFQLLPSSSHVFSSISIISTIVAMEGLPPDTLELLSSFLKL
ncbi:hypothetical protein PF010_g20655 [Phytophthora fragariae]|uniref:RxLR effector protein n=1 Tax=Phytophthora fragariae TaxID=53985 RepID=A0A6A4CDG2_9STRA|nr:hypothetical protein PF011_g19458 [Phytophthora fragariae]KAE9084901.1 hypothetical protein PF010_g20655 [Phytophthora fragariae]KAE9203733.1 hypothetical protein PF002_g20846 [Phytophthora fragariae]KAE9289363.1 hypothetical protein PF001_g20073 [Phytophthora fragariae]